ncbi:MAG: PQQ-binding-like beta-propeller repeat protein [Acidimicrobiales bacterium]|nr:PQQ-binding-like beta-propeller repeat protein [Acidimicrobiales bacterium]
MRYGTGVLAVAMSAVLIGCWPADGAGPDRTGHNPLETTITVDTVATLAEAWTAPLDNTPRAGPVVSARGVHVATATSLYAFRAATGALRWRVGPGEPDAGFEDFAGGLTVRDDEVLVAAGARWAGYRGRWHDAATGQLASGEVSSGQADSLRGSTVAGLNVEFITAGQFIRLHVTDLDAPDAGWSGLLLLGSGVPAPPTVGRSAVFQAGSGVPASPDDMFWVNAVRAYPLRDGLSTCGPAEAPYFACADWTTPLDGTTATAVVLHPGGAVGYVGTDAGTIHAFDTATGAVLWTGAAGGPITEAPALADGTLYVPTSSGDLVAFAADGCGAATCPPAWRAVTGEAITSQPAVASGVVFTGGGNGTIQAFPAAGCGVPTCGALWSADAGGSIVGGPAVTNGRLYVTTDAPALVAYAPAPAG